MRQNNHSVRRRGSPADQGTRAGAQANTGAGSNRVSVALCHEAGIPERSSLCDGQAGPQPAGATRMNTEEAIPLEPAEHADPSLGVAGHTHQYPFLPADLGERRFDSTRAVARAPPDERANIDTEFLAGWLGRPGQRPALGLRATATKN